MTNAPDKNAALDELLDRQAISDCLARYARGVDRIDADLVRSAFWPDARDEAKGSVDEFVEAWLQAQSNREVSQHVIGNHTLAFDGPDAADAETYLLAATKNRDTGTLELMGGRYLDRFEKRNGEWRIKNRLSLLDWQCTTDAGSMEARLSRTYRGTRDRTDPSYARSSALGG